MMKKFVKIVALTLCLATLFSLASCMQETSEETPAGMILATAANDDFRLYVPSTWTPNIAYGVSGAYATLSNLSNVSAVKYPVTEEMAASMPAEVGTADVASQVRLDWFYKTECLSSMTRLTPGGALPREIEAPAPTLLGGSNACRYHQRTNVNNLETDFVHVITERQVSETERAFYVFSFTTDNQLYDTLIPDVNSMIAAFIFAPPFELYDYVRLPGTDPAPAGMKIASNEEVAYLFYVPESWTINYYERIFSAYVEADRSSVSVVPYLPDTATMTPADLCALSEAMMQETTVVGGYHLYEQDNSRTVAGRPANTYRYYYTVDGERYEYLQVITEYGGMFYCITYTARPEVYYDHINEVEQILANFAFRE